MLTLAAQFVGGFALLLVGGRLLVAASVDAAKRLRVSPLVIGLTLVAWGTSAPELALNLISAFKGRGELALGNVVGANICNMALVLGVCALIKPIVVRERLIRVEMWLNAILLAFMSVVGIVTGIERWEAALMLCAFGAYSAWTIIGALRKTDRAASPEAANTLGDDPTRESTPMGWIMILACFGGGLALLSFGGTLASDGAAELAIALGIPSGIVGVTIVSIGTTLPELVTSVMAVRKGQVDLAMGNIIGSCLFNAGAIFGVVGMVAPPQVERPLALSLAYMGLLAIALVPMCHLGRKNVTRRAGAVLVASYAIFLAASAAAVMALS